MKLLNSVFCQLLVCKKAAILLVALVKKASLRCSDLCRCKKCKNKSLETEEEKLKELEDTNNCADSKDSDESDSDEFDIDFDCIEAADEEPRILSEWETSVVHTDSGAESDSSY